MNEHMTPPIDPREESNLQDQLSRNAEPTGDIATSHRRGDSCTRLFHTNIKHFPQNSQHPKSEAIRQTIDRYQANIVTFVEMNINWKLIPAKERLEYCTRPWWETSRWSYSYNIHAKTSSISLFGGTAVLTIRETTARIWAHDLNNPSGLGRWSATRCRG